ncbi:MAG: hypothetical protein ACJ79H_21720 [Myxococcales bacterium]
MSHFFGPIKDGDGAGGMRERGFRDGTAGIEPRPPSDPKLAAAYEAGHKKGVIEREKRKDEWE